MRRKSARNASKTTEKTKTPETPARQTRRSRRRKVSESASGSEASDEDIKPQLETVTSEPISTTNQPTNEEIVWKVTKTESHAGEIQKLKISVCRTSPSTPERTSKRRRNKSSSQNEDDSATEDSIRRTRQHGSPLKIMEEVEEKEEKKGKGKSKGKTKTKIESTSQVSEIEPQKQYEISENVQVTPQSPSDTDKPVDNESIPEVESNDDNEQKLVEDVNKSDNIEEQTNQTDDVQEDIDETDKSIKTEIKIENLQQSDIQNVTGIKTDDVKLEIKNEELNIDNKVNVKTNLKEECAEGIKSETPNNMENIPKTESKEFLKNECKTEITNEIKVESSTVSIDKKEIEVKPDADVAEALTEVATHTDSEMTQNESSEENNDNLKDKQSINEKEQPLVENEPISMVNEQPSIVNEQSSMINEKPSVVNEQPSIVNEKSSIVNEQPSIVNEQPLKVNNQPLMANDKKKLKDSHVDEKELTSQGDNSDTNKDSADEINDMTNRSKVSTVENVAETKQNESSEEDNALKSKQQVEVNVSKTESIADKCEEPTKDILSPVEECNRLTEDAMPKTKQAKRLVTVNDNNLEVPSEKKEEFEDSKRKKSHRLVLKRSKQDTPVEDQNLKTEECSKTKIIATPINLDEKEDTSKTIEKPQDESMEVDKIESQSPTTSDVQEIRKSPKPAKKKSQPIKLNRNFESTTKELSERFDKSKWLQDYDYLDVVMPNLIKIDYDLIKNIYLDVELLDETDVKLDLIENKDRRVSIDRKSERKMSEASETDQNTNFERQNSYNSTKTDNEIEETTNIIAMNRKISIVDDSASKLRPPPSPSKHPVSSILFITNLVRPFTLKQLKELLERTGKIVEDGFWTDRIKSKCFVQYEMQEEAEATRNALHGVNWPIGNGKKLIIDYGTLEDLETARNPPSKPPEISSTTEKENQEPVEKVVEEKEERRRESHIREWDVGKEGTYTTDRTRSRSRDRHHKVEKRRHSRHSPSPTDDFISRKQKKIDEAVPQKLMDDLFQKTKAMPSIYWQPLTPDEISTKQQQRLQRMAEHKRRMEETSRTRTDYTRGGLNNRRRYD